MTDAPAPEPQGRGGWIGWAAALAVVALVVILYSPAPQTAPVAGGGGLTRDVTAAGYSAIIDDIFSSKGENWLRLDNSGNPNAQLVTVSAAALRYPEVMQFYRDSFLREDIASRDASLWRIDEGRVTGIADDAHAVPLPFAGARDWSGEIDYRDDAQVETRVTLGDRTFLLSPRTVVGDNPTHPSVELFPARAPAEPASEAPPAAEEAADLLHLTDGGQPAAELYRIGGSIPVIRLETPDVRVLVDGVELKVGEGEAAYARLEPGSRVVVERQRDNRRAVLNVSSGVDAISRVGPLGDRIRDPTTLSLAMALEGAMNTAVGDGASNPPQRLSLTLDADTQARLQAALETYAESGRARLPGRPAFRATITVMDLASGDVLALASYPRTAEETGFPDPRSSATRRLIEHNHNFERLSIGSAAKPIFVSAILQQFPGLDKLVLQGGYGAHDVDDLFGVALDPPLNEDGMPNPIDFQTFLSQSSNRYAATMMLLAASRDPFGKGDIPTGETYQLNGPHTVLPKLVFDNDAPPGQPAHLVPPDSNFVGLLSDPNFQGGAGKEPAWPMWLDQLYDLPYFEHVAQGEQTPASLAAGGESYDFKVWAPLIARLGERAEPPFRDSSVSPEREQLGMNVINNFRTDYINLVIGGGRSQWTTVKLAEIYGRIVSGRWIDARLVRSMDQTAVALGAHDSPAWNPQVRSDLLNGMAHVSIDGTAHSARMTAATRRLQALAAQRGETLEVYSKTGTPTLEVRVASPTGLAIEELSSAGFVRADGETQHAGVAAGLGLMIWPTDEASRASAARALARSPQIMTTLEQFGTSPDEVARYLMAYNLARTPTAKAAWLYLDSGRLIAAQQAPTRANGRAYVVVLARKTGKPGEVPSGIVVAINIQQNWEVNQPSEAGLANHVAAALGAELMEGALDRPLFLTDPNPPRNPAAPAATPAAPGAPPPVAPAPPPKLVARR
jgi:cell division protein FtsI/penicillin-binding protein 2